MVKLRLDVALYGWMILSMIFFTNDYFWFGLVFFMGALVIQVLSHFMGDSDE